MKMKGGTGDSPLIAPLVLAMRVLVLWSIAEGPPVEVDPTAARPEDIRALQGVDTARRRAGRLDGTALSMRERAEGV